MAYRRSFLRLLGPFPVVAFAAWLAAPRRPALELGPGGRSPALVADLQALHLETAASDVHWIDASVGALASRFVEARAVVRARRPGEAWDIYLARTRLSPEGALLETSAISNLTRTSVASEASLVTEGEHAAWTIGDAARTYRVELVDLHGEPRPSGPDWTRLGRVQHAISNLQGTGQLSGVGYRSFKLDPAAQRLTLGFEGERLIVFADGHRISIPFDAHAPIDGLRYLREDDREIARPGNLITWAVDRARALSWFGDERMQFTKAIAYAALDRVDRAIGAVHEAAAQEPDAEELGGDAAPAVHADPDSGFPPGAITPPLAPPLPGEGRWFLLDHDPYVRTTPGVPVPLATTFIRPDGARPDSLVYVIAWDPRQVDLDVVAGTEEPQSATGETGDGLIPRKPGTMSHLIAAFNGAFQSTHGDFGMMDDGAIVVPPKPFAATIARLDDGATGFGTWPKDLTIPAGMTSFRQNLTPLVADGRFNPYNRDWWGGVPHDWEDETHTVRSGLCLTKEGFVEYFYGTNIDHVHLGRAMLAARCDYGVHLDMNQGHTGLEVYRADLAKNLPPLPDKLDGHWQAEGDVSGMPGWRFRGRRLIRNMQLMHFPRYIRRGARDFFYLTVRPLLPLAPLTGLSHEGDEGTWKVRGLPQHGFPYAIATTSVRPLEGRPETKVRIVAIDTKQLRLASTDASDLVLSLDPIHPAGPAQSSLWFTASGGVLGKSAPSPTAVRVATGSLDPAGAVAAALGVDPDGIILYAEVATAPDPARDGAMLGGVLAAEGCTGQLFLSSAMGLALGGSRDLADHPVRIVPGSLRFARGPVAGSRRIFPETPILPPEQWMPLQRQTRWFPKEATSAASSPAAPAAPP